MDLNTLVIFDYSGTLSIGAVEFGRPDSLQRQLEKSGLANLGLDTPVRYWQSLVAPTWPSASRTDEGFKPIATRHIQRFFGQATDPAVIASAIDKFVDAYLRHSAVDPSWLPLLDDIRLRADTLGLIATDHYAEATAVIREHLATLGIAAVPAVPTGPDNYPEAFKIANSADIGYPKTDYQFWQTLENTCLTGPFKKVVLVDDFGCNEQDQSGYATTAMIEDRITVTRLVLQDVFGPEPQIFHFSIGRNAAPAIAETSEAVRKALSS